MKTRVKLLLAAAILAAATLKSAPAEAGICQSQPFDGFYSEYQCAQYCYSGGCQFYEFIGSGCYCS